MGTKPRPGGGEQWWHGRGGGSEGGWGVGRAGCGGRRGTSLRGGLWLGASVADVSVPENGITGVNDGGGGWRV